MKGCVKLINHEEKVRNVFSSFTTSGTLKSRESQTIEFKESFNKSNTAKYAKTMASYANNKGGYIIFGVKDNPRTVTGLSNNSFDNLNQEQFTETINSLFSPAIEWECGITVVEIPIKYDGNADTSEQKKIGWIYSEESDEKPIIAQKNNENEKISSGDVYYRYRARTQKIKYAEMRRILNEQYKRRLESTIKILETAKKSGTANLGIINYSNGRMTTPFGIDAIVDQKIITKVLKKAKFIHEGSFNETDGIPVIKVTGNIETAKEVPVPEGNPDDTHPYIQKQLACKLGIAPQVLYALIWYYKMKEANKYHLAITVSKNCKTHKFSEFALQFLSAKLKEFSKNPQELDNILYEYKNRNKVIKSK